MSRQDSIFIVLKPETLPEAQFSSFAMETHQSIDHHVTYKMDSAFCDPFVAKIRARCLVRGEKKVAEDVRHNAIDFFWHSSVVAAKASFDVSYRNIQFACGQCASHRGVHIAHHHHNIRRLCH